jgi:hypothetical protein
MDAPQVNDVNSHAGLTDTLTKLWPVVVSMS